MMNEASPLEHLGSPSTTGAQDESDANATKACELVTSHMKGVPKEEMNIGDNK